MSYNISKWQTKKLEGLEVLLSGLYDLSKDLIRRGWQPDLPIITKIEDGQIYIKIDLDSGELLGVLTPDNQSIRVTKIDISGEGSGTLWHDVLQPALEQSKGELVAIRIWEGGDSMDKLIVKDGVVESQPIEF